MKSFSKINTSLFFGFFLLVLTSCGGSSGRGPMVSDVSVQTASEDGEVYVALDAVLNIGDISLDDLTLPIVAPKSGDEIGYISLYTDLERKNVFEIELNLTAITGHESVVAKLPNGNALPLIRENNTIVIPIEDKAQVYLTFSNSVAAIGATVNIKGLDSVGEKVGKTSLFPSFAAGSVIGSAGIYTSSEAGSNGFGIFADVTQLVDLGKLNDSIDFGGQRSAQKVIQQEVTLDYAPIKPSKRKSRSLNRRLYKLHKDKAVL